MSESINKKIVGIDVGIRKAFTFSDGLVFYVRGNERDTERFVNFLADNYHNYIFVVESFLKENLLKIPFKKDSLYVKNTNKIIKFFLKEYKERIVYIDSAYTSLTCSKCGIMCKEGRLNALGRRTAKDYYCFHCDIKINSDLNAAKNILQKYLTIN